ncbi:MAG: hypothetical protein M1820_010572 [Bogoriella megaspora]|nr:MAG: hypothetical protein M1820_010572 [Bogoriella megaspora]
MPISYVPSSGGILLPNGQTLHPGSSAMINGVPVSLSPSENGLQVGSSSISLEGPLVSASDASQSLTIDDRIIPISFASNGAGIILPDGQTLAAGQSSNIDGVPVHLASGGSYIVEGSSTIPLGTPLATQSITFGSSIVPVSLLPNGEGIVLPNDLTIHPGQNTVVYGLAASLAPGDNAVVVNGTTQVLQPGSPTTDVGNYIASGIGYSNTSAGTGSFTIPSSTPGSTVQAAGSDAERKFRLERSLWVSIALLGALALW